MRTLTLLFLLTLYTQSFAQLNGSSISANVNISATVIRSIELITVNSITFENTQPGQLEIVVNPVTDVNSGFMIAVGTPGTEFRIDYFQERELQNTSGQGFITFEYAISTNDIEDQATSSILDYEDRNLRFNAQGRYYIWVGGRVGLENAAPGNYEGDFTIEIDYI